MSGLLQRLAARATGSAWALRSDARLPFASAPGMVEVLDTEPPQPATSHRPIQAEPSQPTLSRPANLPPPEPTPAAMLPLAPARQWAGAEDAPTAPGSAQSPLAAVHSEVAAQPTAPDDRPHGAVATGHRPITERTASPLAQGPAPHADPAPLLPTAMERGAATHRQTAAGIAQHGMPRAPHAQQPLRQPLATPATAAEPTEVHVHIGRIEVTAITQPQPQKRAAREHSQPLSLDAYLARRKEPS